MLMDTIALDLSTSRPILIKLHLLRMLPLENALFSVPRGDRNAGIVARHYGFDGRGGANFQRIGNEFRLTRERVRQIVTQSDPRRQILPGDCSALDCVSAFIAAGLPAPAAEIEAKLHRSGLTMEPFRIEGIVNVARLLHHAVQFRISVLNKTRFVLPASWPQFRDIVRHARRLVRRHGMAAIAEFTNDVRDGEVAQRESKLIETILSGRPDFRWLDRGSGWFWIAGAPGNCAVRRIRKMLAVANPLTVEELRAGLGRKGAPPVPAQTLLAFCRQAGGLSVREDLIYARPRIDAAEVLNKTERDIYRLLSENNGCMANSDLILESGRLGMKRPTFYQCVTYSPIVVRCDGGHYRLIGRGAPASYPIGARTA
jgi:hypothetical protein